MSEKKVYSRRYFLEMLGLTGAGISLMGMAEPAMNHVAARDDNSWKIFMFSKHLQFLDYEETAETMKEAGLDGADLSVRPGGHVLPENVKTNLPEACDAFEKAGLKVGMITTRITDASDPLTEPILKIASEAGIKYYRMGYLSYDEALGIEESLLKHHKTLEKLADLNSRYGIHGAYQNHSGRRVGGPVWDVWTMLRGLDSRWIGCQYDIRHAVAEGGYSWPLAMQLLQQYIKTIVIKDFKWVNTDDRGWRIMNVPLGEGMVDFDEYFQLLKELNIQAPISLHFEYPLFEGENLDKKEKRVQAVKNMRRDLGILQDMLKRNGIV